MRALFLLAGVPSLPMFVLGVVALGEAHGASFAAWAAFTCSSGLLALSFGGWILRHRGVPPALAQAFFRDPPGWKIIPVGDPQSAARFEVVRAR